MCRLVSILEVANQMFVYRFRFGKVEIAAFTDVGLLLAAAVLMFFHLILRLERLWAL